MDDDFDGSDNESANDTIDNESDGGNDPWWNNMIRSKLESDDDWLTRLFIDSDGSEYQPTDGDWERDGLAVGRNTHLQLLGLHTSPKTNEEMVKFFSVE